MPILKEIGKFNFRSFFMKKLVFGTVILLTILSLSGCGEVQYKKYGEGITSRVGYSEFEIGHNKYKVTYTGGVYDNQQQVMKFTYKRAHDLCKEKGFNESDITNTNLNNEVSSTTTQNYGLKTQSWTDTKSQKIYSLDVQCK
jgi:hypothetical protein